MQATHHVLLDTDIGSDVDDALALALILGCPEIELEGVTTVYGDTGLRARIARRYLELAGRQDVDVVPGLESPLSGREVWWPGHEGLRHEALDRQVVRRDRSAPEYIASAVESGGSRLQIVAIGPLTNLAAAHDLSPSLARDIGSIWMMGGAFGHEEPEHNIVSDVTAAQAVLGSTAEIRVLPLDVTERVQLTSEQVDRIATSGPVGAQLGEDIRQWWEVRGTSWNVPHDPLTVLAVVHPDMFRFSGPGRVQVEASGRTTFTPDPLGTTRVAIDLDIARVVELMLAGIARASQPVVPGS